MSPIAEAATALDSIALAARNGLSSNPRSLPPWLFYDEPGSILFEQITTLPEYYLTRTERELFAAHADKIFLNLASPLTIVELGAGTATKTGVLLSALARLQHGVLYQPIDISSSALDGALALEAVIPGLTVRPRVANYITDPTRIYREADRKVLALYIGSSIGNFSPAEASGILANLRSQLRPGDALLLGTDLAPSANKSIAALISAYDDDAGITAAFNLNILRRLNRELGANFALDCFRHEARWNAAESRIEMHLVSSGAQTVTIPSNSAGPVLKLRFAAGESIHTENSYKFTTESIAALLAGSCFAPNQTFEDPNQLFAVNLATAV